MTRGATVSRRAAAAGLAGLALGVVPLRAAAALSYQPLFRIERNKNANVVQYDAVLESPDRLSARTPVVNYWVLLAEDGRREGLSALDRRAYGFKVVPEREGAWLLYLGPTPKRAIRVVRWQGRWLAQTVIRGRSAVLTRMFVMADESAFIPRVKWVDVHGTDMETGAALTERLAA
jgi:hypothetical protein